MKPGERLLTSTEVAELLAVHVNTVKRLPPEELPFVRIVPRGDRRYELADVRRFLQQRRSG